MKLKCNHDRRVHVLPSGNTVHRSDGTRCFGDGSPFKPPLTMGNDTIIKRFTMKNNPGNMVHGNFVLVNKGLVE